MEKKLLKKMVLVGLMLCVWAIIHPAAAPDDSSEDVDIAQRFAPGGSATNDDFEQLSRALQNRILGGLLSAHGNNVQEAFFYAVRNNLLWAIQPLLDEGADLGAHSYDRTALMIAAQRGQTEMVEVLTSVKKPIFNSLDQLKYSFLGKSVDFERNITIVQREPANHYYHINHVIIDYTALMLAVENNHAAIVQLLLDRKAEVNLRYEDDDGFNICGKTALMHAARKGYTEIIKLLLYRKAYIDAVDSVDMSSLLWAAHNGHTAAVEVLIAAKASLEFADYSSRMTALMCAAAHDHTETVNALIASKAQLEVGDKRGKTALMIAAQYAGSATVKALIDSGACIDTYNRGYVFWGCSKMTALILAAQRGDIEIIRLLIDGYRKQLAESSCSEAQDLERKIQYICGRGRTQLAIQSVDSTPNDSNGNRAAFEQLPNEWLQLMTEYLSLSALTNLRRASRSCCVVSQDQFGKQFTAHIKGKFNLEQEEKCREFVDKEIYRAHLPNPLAITIEPYNYWQAALDAVRPNQDSDVSIAAPAPALKSGCAIA